MPRALHVVQIGADDAVFRESGTTDTLDRQLEYGRELLRRVQGSRITNLVLTSNGSAKPFQRENVSFVPVNAMGIRRLYRLWRELQKTEQTQPIDVITSQTVFEDAWISLLFSRLHRIPVVGQIHFDIFNADAARVELGTGMKGLMRRKLGLRAIKQFYTVRVVSRYLKNEIARLALAKRVRIIPVPITMRAASEPSLDKEMKVLFVGRLVDAKNLNAWLRVAAEIAKTLPEARFHIVGDGPQRHELEREASRLGISSVVEFHGHKNYADLAELYRTARVFLLTSLYEGFGRVVVESYFNFLPVVSTRVTGVEDIVVHEKTGYLREQGNFAGLASDVVRLLRDRDLNGRMGQAGHAVVIERFDPKTLKEAWVDLLISAATRQYNDHLS